MDTSQTPRLTPESVAFLEGFIKECPKARILEFGCGESTVWLSHKLKFPKAKLVSIEQNPEQYQAVKDAISPRVDLRLSDHPYMACDEFADNAFDVVIIGGPDQVLCAGKSMRLVGPGGVVILAESNESCAPIGDVLLKDWDLRHTTSYDPTTQSQWHTDMWRKPAEKNVANVADDMLVRHGETAFRQGDTQKSETLAVMAIESNTCVADAFNLLGVIWGAKNDARGALAFFEAGKTLEPNHDNISKNLAAIQANSGNREEQIRMMNRINVSQDAVSQSAPQDSSRVVEQGQGASQDWLRQITNRINQACGNQEKLIEIAGELIEHDQADTAEQLCRMVIAQDPGYAEAHNTLGIIYHISGSLRDAQRYFETAYRLTPGNSDVAKNLIGVYTQTQQFEKAVEICQESIKQHPEDRELLEIVGRLLESIAEYAFNELETPAPSQPAPSEPVKLDVSPVLKLKLAPKQPNKAE